VTVIVATDDGVLFDGRHELAGTRVRALGRAGDNWWAVTQHGLVRRADATWTDVACADGLTSVAAAGELVVVGTDDGRVLRLDGDRLDALVGFDRVPGRDTWHAVGSSKPYVRSLSTTVDGVLLVNVHVGGIPRSVDRGVTWSPTIDVDADVHEVRAHPQRSKVALAAAAVGLCRTDDAGETWSILTDGLHATYCRAVACAADVLFVSASTGPSSERGAVYRRALDDSGPLERCTRGLPEWLPYNIDTGALATDATTAVFGGRDGTVYVSDDAGRTWRSLADDLAPVNAVAIA
jgi:hypothetical protein